MPETKPRSRKSSSGQSADSRTEKKTRAARHPREGRGWDLLALAAILVAGIAAYSNSLNGPFVFDDRLSIVSNSTIRDLSNLGGILWAAPRNGATVDGRPLLNLSLACNYAVHALNVRGYHVTNLALHLLNASLLWLVVREILRSPQMSERFRRHERAIALSIALIWVVHPLTTAAVTYVIQRAEALVACFYLLAAYCFLRGCRDGSNWRWLAGATAACLIGQSAKEVMVTAPLSLLLIDVACASGSFRGALRQRGWWHAANFATWGLAAVLILGNGGRSGTVALGDQADRWANLAAQAGHLLHYLRLCYWPSPLIFDYGDAIPPLTTSQIPQVVAACVLALAAFGLFVRHPLAGLPAVLVFVILAPTSSFVPVITQVAAEHRMYLPLAAVVGGTVFALAAALDGVGRRFGLGGLDDRRVQRWLLALTGGVAVALGTLTFARNATYQSALALWLDTVAKTPTSVRACEAAAAELVAAGRGDEAPQLFAKAIQGPRAPLALCTRAEIWVQLNQPDQAEADCRAALALDPQFHRAWNNLGILAMNRQDYDLALSHFNRALELDSRNVLPLMNRGNVMVLLHRNGEARRDYLAAISLKPAQAELHYLLARLDHSEGRLGAAADGYRRALYYEPDHAYARQSLADVLDELKR